MIICAIIIAVGVYNSLYDDNNPWEDKSKYKKSPTTTGGKLISALIVITITSLPKNLFEDKSAAIGIEIIQEIKIANNDTCKDNITISMTL